jgi:hypothetical protein
VNLPKREGTVRNTERRNLGFWGQLRFPSRIRQQQRKPLRCDPTTYCFRCWGVPLFQSDLRGPDVFLPGKIAADRVHYARQVWILRCSANFI